MLRALLKITLTNFERKYQGSMTSLLYMRRMELKETKEVESRD